MGKATMCIRMLQLLNSGRIYKCSELADLLDTNPRNVIEYKKELEEAGYCIISVPGKNGGYRLDMTTTIPSLKFTEDEKRAVTAGSAYLNARNDFLYKKDYQSAISKVYSSLRMTAPEEETTVINRFPLQMPKAELEKRYYALKGCLAQSKQSKGKVVEMEYLSLKNEVSVRSIHPYKLFMYNNAWFVLSYDESSSDFRYFKLNRILSFKITNKTFRMLLSYNESDFLDEFGMKQNGEWYPIKLKLSGSYAMLVRERIYGKNQTVECVDNNTTILSCEMQNKSDIVSFVLGFGTNCEVIEPQWLREEVKSVCEKLLKIGLE